MKETTEAIDSDDSRVVIFARNLRASNEHALAEALVRASCVIVVDELLRAYFADTLPFDVFKREQTPIANEIELSEAEINRTETA